MKLYIVIEVVVVVVVVVLTGGNVFVYDIFGIQILLLLLLGGSHL